MKQFIYFLYFILSFMVYSYAACDNPALLAESIICNMFDGHYIPSFEQEPDCENEYIEPQESTQDLSQFECHIEQFLLDPINYTGENPPCTQSLANLGYEIINDGDYRIFYELINDPDNDPIFEKGWGIYIFNTNATRENLVIHSNHPRADSQTRYIAANIFERTGAAWLFVAGAHRWACVDTEPNETDDEINETNYGADMAREEYSLFQTFHEQISISNHNDSSHTISISIHGFGDSSYDTYLCTGNELNELGIVLSNGVEDDDGDGIDDIVLPSDLTRMMTGKFIENISLTTNNYDQPAAIVYDGLVGFNYENLMLLKASLNPQGNFTNFESPSTEDNWIHVEADHNIRTTPNLTEMFYQSISSAIDEHYDTAFIFSSVYGCGNNLINSGECDILFCDCTSYSEKIYNNDDNDDEFFCGCNDGEVEDICGICSGDGTLCYPVIQSIDDVPNDQGGRVYVNFSGTVHDDNYLRNEIYSIEREDGTDNWVNILSGVAYGEDEYTYEVTTLENNTPTSFRVIAGMDEGNFVSNPFSGTSIDNISPSAPTISSIDPLCSRANIDWSESTDIDFAYFEVYRDGSSIDTSVDPVYEDDSIQSDTLYEYHIVSVDANGNLSLESNHVSLTLPSIFMLGDVNSDSEVDILDVIVIINYILNDIELEEVQLLGADWNEDCDISVPDIVIIVSIILNEPI